MRKTFCFIGVLVMVIICGCKAKSAPAPAPAPKQQESGYYNIAQIPALSGLKRQTVQYVSYEQSQTVSGIPDLKSSYMAIRFPFPFTVKESYVKKGDTAGKGTALFLLESEKMEEALIAYGKTREPGLAALLKGAGINTDGTPTPLITIIAPAAGRVIATFEDDTLRSVSPHDVAVLQIKNDLNIQITVPASLVNEDTKFFVNMADKTVPVKMLSSSGEQSLKINLVLENADGMPDSERLQVIALNSRGSTFPLIKDAVFNRDGKTYCFVEVSDGILAQREISGIASQSQFIAAEGLKENERVINDNIQPVLRQFKIQ